MFKLKNRLRSAMLMGTAVATIIGATAPAADAADTAHAYASVFGGVSILQNPGLKGSSHTSYYSYLTSLSSQSADTSFKTGFVVGGNFGIDWGNNLRTELELALRQNNSSSHALLKTSYSYMYSGAGPYTVSKSTSTVPANMNLRAWSLMANAWYDFDVDMPFTPYVGGGFGMAMVQISGNLNGFNLHKKNDTVFAWQLGAGVSMPITDNIKAFLDYRYFAADSAALKLEPGFHGGDITANFDSHTVLVGLRFNL